MLETFSPAAKEITSIIREASKQNKHGMKYLRFEDALESIFRKNFKEANDIVKSNLSRESKFNFLRRLEDELKFSLMLFTSGGLSNKFPKENLNFISILANDIDRERLINLCLNLKSTKYKRLRKTIPCK